MSSFDLIEEFLMAACWLEVSSARHIAQEREHDLDVLSIITHSVEERLVLGRSSVFADSIDGDTTNHVAAVSFSGVAALVKSTLSHHQCTECSLQQHLTAREFDILRLLAAGMTNPQIALQLVIGTGTVKTHTLNIYRKLGVTNRTQAIVRAHKLGLLHT